MTGDVYEWEIPQPGSEQVFRVVRARVPLRNLLPRPLGTAGNTGLQGRFVRVRNACVVNEMGRGGEPQAIPAGDLSIGVALGGGAGGVLAFEPGRGGGRVDKVVLAAPDFRWRYLQAARFGEVNTYVHVDRIAAYVDELLRELGAPSLPPVVAVVNAHAASVARAGARDGRHCPNGKVVPFQGGHYRLPGRTRRVPEIEPLSPDGEIHLGPGRRLTAHGALARLVGGAYRVNASHNPAIIYHEYGHHLTRHTADFRANRHRAPDRQSNRKTALDEGTADYLTAVMLGTPHIWSFHHRDDARAPHRRSLLSPRTMQSFVPGRAGDPHANGTIWAAALWDLRARVADGRRVDRLLVQALLLIGREGLLGSLPDGGDRVGALVSERRSFRRAGAALLDADALLDGGALRSEILAALGARGIEPTGPVGASGTTTTAAFSR